MHIVRASLTGSDVILPIIPIRVERRKLAKTLWRGVAEDGAEFGFDLGRPLEHEAIVYQTDLVRYQIAQQPEACLEVKLDLAVVDALHLGWAIGNLHLEIEGRVDSFLTPEEVSVTRLLTRLGVPYSRIFEVFKAGSFAGDFSHFLLPSHSHGHHHHPVEQS